MTPRVFLMGMKHCGKSTLGRLLAARLHTGFADLDECAGELFARNTGRGLTVREIYRTEGREAFQALEAEALREICGDPACSYESAGVVALGGGTIENAAAFAATEGRGLRVFLDDDEDVLFQRIAASGIPPFLEGPAPRETFHKLYECRTALYRGKADISIDMRGLSPEEAVETIEKKLEDLHGRQ